MFITVTYHGNTRIFKAVNI